MRFAEEQMGIGLQGLVVDGVLAHYDGAAVDRLEDALPLEVRNGAPVDVQEHPGAGE